MPSREISLVDQRKHFKEAVARIVELLVASDFQEVVRLTRGTRLDLASIREAITRYGRALISPPASAYEQMDVMEIRGSVPEKWSVNMPLWTREEGRSDLTLEVTIARIDETYFVELDDIHVL